MYVRTSKLILSMKFIPFVRRFGKLLQMMSEPSQTEAQNVNLVNYLNNSQLIKN